MWSYYPGLIMMSLLDLDRNYLTSFGKSNISMSVQIFSPFIHFVVAYLFTIKLEFGVLGIGFSGFVTNLIIYKL
jgi:Na+-driven multidrug efflux pump